MTVPVHGLPPLLKPGMTVALVPPALKTDRWHTTRSVNKGPSGQLVAFSDITSIDAADELVGRTILADVASLPQDFELYDADALLGREVVDTTYGFLGSIEEVLRGTAHDVWVIRGPYGEVLVPVVDEFVRHTEGFGAIETCVPQGTIPVERT